MTTTIDRTWIEQRGFIPYRSGLKRGVTGKRITISKNGNVSISSELYLELDRPAAFTAQYEPNDGTVLLRPAERSHDALSVTEVNKFNNPGGTFGARRLLTIAGWPLGVRRVFMNPPMVDGWIVLDPDRAIDPDAEQ